VFFSMRLGASPVPTEWLAPRARRVTSALVLIPVVALVLFHAALLWARVSAGRLADPNVGLRWAGAALLIAALIVLRRRGVSLFWGRRALVFWLLVLLLHAGIAAPVPLTFHADSAKLLFVLPASAAPLALAFSLMLARLLREHDELRPVACRSRTGDGRPATRRGVLLQLAPRAPPA
jgi:hypothetical protein